MITVPGYTNYNCFFCTGAACVTTAPAWDVYFTKVGANLSDSNTYYKFVIGTSTSNGDTFADPLLTFTAPLYGAIANTSASYVGKAASLTLAASSWSPTGLPLAVAPLPLLGLLVLVWQGP